MSGPSTRPKRKAPMGPAFAPNPSEELSVAESFESADRGEFLSPEESAEFVRELLGDPDDRK